MGPEPPEGVEVPSLRLGADTGHYLLVFAPLGLPWRVVFLTFVFAMVWLGISVGIFLVSAGPLLPVFLVSDSIHPFAGMYRTVEPEPLSQPRPESFLVFGGCGLALQPPLT